MLVIKTEHGIFGSFKDLYRFMKEENINSLKVTTNYVVNDINTQTLTIDDIKSIIEN